jgi:hypothetical protein
MYRRGELALLLRQEDRIGMWHWLECRVPFVDDPLVRVAARIPPEVLFEGGRLKSPLRLLYPDLPESVRFATAKSGFWETDMRRFADLGRCARRLCLRSDTLRRLLPEIEAGWAGLRLPQRWRLMQIAVLERCADRAGADELATELERGRPARRVPA